MRFRFFHVVKCAQTAIIAFMLWRVFSESEICGTFVGVKEVIRNGIDGTCRRLFFYVNPMRNGNLGGLWHLPHLRLWWIYEGSVFLPPVPNQQELGAVVADIKAEISANSPIPRARKEKEVVPVDTERKKRDFDGLPESGNMGQPVPKEVASNNGMDAKTMWRAMELEEAKVKTNMLPHEEQNNKRKRRNSAPPDSTLLQQGNANERKLFCYELNLQHWATESAVSQSMGSPLVVLGNRSIVTVAMAMANLLLLFTQVYLLNCLDEDNLVQKKGKLFLELFVVMLGWMGWLIVFLLKVRTEFDWEPIWVCSNFRPHLLKMVVIVQVLAATMLLLGLLESIQIYRKMRKISAKIEEQKRKDLIPQRPKIPKF